ncbi:outer membrane beta-barrel protein [Shewanella sp. JM162201]|uniref:Outer membrane beta-barrel protein n=1 Tax=Shewanella jiangmenensis TaxID=2837387 RepID=A0ABS5V3P1_9GAMM|nr:outer membrane beta-barrel protein [Shewanella jiangmenensis]MBT1445064.1 outer membrane beta-barrel protein [Shewanella jiangmenensis]
MKMNLLQISSIALISISTFAESTESNTLNYSHVGIGYTTAEYEFSDDYSGYTASLLQQIAQSGFYITLKHSKTSSDLHTAIGDLDQDLTQANYGAGYAFHLTPTFHIGIEAAYIKLKAEIQDYSDSGSGYRLGTLLRYATTPALELYSGLDYLNLDEWDDSDTAYKVGAKYAFGQHIAITAEYNNFVSDGAWVLGAEVRW